MRDPSDFPQTGAIEAIEAMQIALHEPARRRSIHEPTANSGCENFDLPSKGDGSMLPDCVQYLELTGRHTNLAACL